MNRVEFKALNNWEKVRTLTGMIPDDRESMLGRLALSCLISRVELGDADPDFLDETIDKYLPPADGEEDVPEQLELPLE